MGSGTNWTVVTGAAATGWPAGGEIGTARHLYSALALAERVAFRLFYEDDDETAAWPSQTRYSVSFANFYSQTCVCFTLATQACQSGTPMIAEPWLSLGTYWTM